MAEDNEKIGPALVGDGNFRILMAVTFLAVMGVSSVTPALPTMMEALAVHPADIGWVVTAFALGGAISTPVSGVLADRLGRRRVLAPALLFFGLAGLACGLAQSFPQLLLLRFLQGVGAGPLNTMTFTMAGDMYDGRRRVMAMGILGMTISIGSATASLAGGLTASAGWRWIFVMPILALACWWLVHYKMDVSDPEVSRAGMAAYLRQVAGLLASWRTVGLLVATFFVFILLFGAYLTYVPVMLHLRMAAAPHIIGLAMTVVTAFIALGSAQIGRLTARLGSRGLIIAGFGLYCVSMLGLAWTSSYWTLLASLGLLGLGHGMILPSIMNLLSDLAPPELRAALMSVNALILRLSQTVAPVALGLVMLFGGIRDVFLAGAGVAALAVVVVWAALGRAATRL